MRIHRLHSLGASGAGTTTLGRALAQCLNSPHCDTDEYFWFPTNPPFVEPHGCTARQRKRFVERLDGL